MASQLQLRRGTTVQHAPFIGAPAEVTVDTNKKTLVVHDGTTAGGFPVLSASGGTMTGPVSMGGSKITNLATPTAPADAAPKGYIDGLIAAAILADADYGDITVSGAATVWTIDNSAVTQAKIASGAVTEAKIASGAVTEAKIADGAVTEAKIADGAVTSAKIANGTIADADIASDAVTTAKILDANVTTAKLADSAVTTAKINNAAAQTGDAPIYGCRAWVNFDGTAGSTVDAEFRCTIRGSGNVTKVVRASTGLFVVHFTTAMPNSNYATLLTASDGNQTSTLASGGIAASSVEVRCWIGASAAAFSPSVFTVSVFA